MKDERTYKNARAVSADVGRSKNQGTPYVRVAFEFLGDDGKATGQGDSWDGYLTERTSERTIEALKVCGWDGKDWDGFEGLGSSVVRLTIGPETYKGSTFEKILWVNAAQIGRPIPEEFRVVGKARQALADQFSGSAPKPAAAKPTFDDDGFDDDDNLPF